MLIRGHNRAPVAAAVLAAALSVGTSAIAQTAPPQDVPQDVLQLTDGTTLRGRVLELRLFQDATIRLEDGTIRTVAWSAIASGSADIWNLHAAANWRAAVAPAAPPSVPAPMVAPPWGPDDLLRPGPGRVPLRVESDGAPQNVGIGVWGRRREALAVVCTTPCTMYVFPGIFPLYTGGPNVRPTVQPVMVTGAGVTVLAHAGSPMNRALGVAMIPLGAIGMLASVVLMLDPPGPSSSPAVGGLLGLGSVAMIIGGAVMLRNARPGLTYVGPVGEGIGMGARF